jgi:Aerotolerance regulator N-terminal
MLTFPAALLGLLALAPLVAIYLFHRKPRTRNVSSLMLWAALRRPAIGGRKREFLRLPLTFWLEALAIALLVLAAAGPLLPRLARQRPLIVILDDSLSMQAGRATTAQSRARDWLRGELRAYDPVRIILAGATPQLATLEQWSCTASTADLDAALALGAQLAGRNALLLVVTDHAPPRKLGPRVRWRAFGEAEPNAAFVAATRSPAGRDRVLFEVAADAPMTTTFTLWSAAAVPPLSSHSGGTAAVLQKRVLQLKRGETQRITLELLPATGAVEARLGDDAAAFDNRVLLLPERRPLVRVRVDVADARLREQIERAINATGRALIADNGELLITDRAQPSPSRWTLELVTHGDAPVTHAGPFVIDRMHPLTAGVDLDGVLWTASRGSLPGAPVILAGSQPLLTDATLAGGIHELRMRVDPALSTLQKSTAWPALLWNLIDWKAMQTPGFRAANVALGATAELALPPRTERVRVTPPGATAREVAPRGNVLPIAASRPGLWRANEYAFACNALDAEESDLSHAASGTWSGWTEASLVAGGYADVAWLALLAALAVLVFWSAAATPPLSTRPRAARRRR